MAVKRFAGVELAALMALMGMQRLTAASPLRNQRSSSQGAPLHPVLYFQVRPPCV